MRQDIPPFVRLGDKLHLVLNFGLEPRELTLEELVQIVRRLAQEWGIDQIAVLRPLTAAEEDLVQWQVKESEVESWARIVSAKGGRVTPRYP